MARVSPRRREAIAAAASVPSSPDNPFKQRRSRPAGFRPQRAPRRKSPGTPIRARAFWIFDSVGGVGWVEVGGTSVGAPSWAGLIAIADQGLALAGKGSLSNAQKDLYQLPSSDFNDITSGSTPFHSAGPGYNLVTGLGSPKANLLIPALVAATSGSSVVPATTTAHASVSILASPHDATIVTG
jgi:subtilase family serine protease